MSHDDTFSYNGAELRLVKRTNVSARHVEGAELETGCGLSRGITDTWYGKVDYSHIRMLFFFIMSH